MVKNSVPAQYALILLDLVERQGFTREALLAGTSLAGSGISEIGARVSDHDFTVLVANASRLSADPALGLHLGLRLNLSAHAVLGQAFMTCQDLAQALDLFLKYYHLLAPSLYLEYEPGDDYCILTTVSDRAETPFEFDFELLSGAMLNTLRGLLNREDFELHLDVPYPEPAHAHLYYSVFGQNVRFNQVRGRIALPRHLLLAPLPSSNPALRSLYEGECARLLADLEEEDSVAEQTLRLMRKLEGQYPQMPQTANMLNLSPRTYRRRLEREGHSYQELLDRVRAEHATRYLQNTRLPLSSIGYMVGFNDASNFRRAYQRWTGRSPADVRRGRQAGIYGTGH